MPCTPWLPSTTWLGSTTGAGVAEPVERLLHRADARSAARRASTVGSTPGTPTRPGRRGAGARVRRGRLPASSYPCDRPPARARTTRRPRRRRRRRSRVARARAARRRRPPARSGGVRTPRRAARAARGGRRPRLLVAHGSCLLSGGAVAAGMMLCGVAVIHGSTLGVNGQPGRFRSTICGALVERDPQRALERRTATARRAAAVADDVAAQLWWIAGLAHRELGDLAAARWPPSSRAATLAASRDDRRSRARVDDQPGVRGRPRRRHPQAPSPCSTPSRPTSTTPTGRCCRSSGASSTTASAGSTRPSPTLRHGARAGDAGGRSADASCKALVNLGAIESPARRVRRRPASTCSSASRSPSTSTSLPGRRWRLANLAYVETVEGNLPEALDAFAVGRGRLPPDRDAGRPAAAVRRPRARRSPTPTCSTTPSTSSTAPSSCRRPAATTSSSPSCCWCRPRSTSPRASRTRPTSAPSTPSPRFTRQGRDSWLHVAERLRLRAEARLTPDEPGIAEGLVMNGRALAAGGWRSDALSSTLLAALLHVRARTRTTRPARCSPGRSGGVRGRGADKVLLGRVTAMLAERGRGPRRGAAGRDAPGCAAPAAAQAGARVAGGALAGRPPRRRADRARRPPGHRGRPAARAAAPHRGDAHDGVARAARARARRRGDGVAADRAAPARARRSATRTPIPTARRAADRERLRVEREIRALSRRARGAARRGRRRRRRRSPTPSPTSLGERDLLAYANLDRPAAGPSSPTAAAARRSTTSAPVAALDDHLEACAFALHRLNRVQGSEARATRPRSCSTTPRTALADQLLPPTRRPLGPPARRRADRRPARRAVDARWHALRGRPVSVSPSLSAWSMAAQAAASGHRSGRDGPARRQQPAAFVAGPALRFADAEVADARPGVRRGRSVLTGRDADGRGVPRPVRAIASSSTSPATARSAPTTRCSRRWRWPTGR